MNLVRRLLKHSCGGKVFTKRFLGWYIYPVYGDFFSGLLSEAKWV